MTFSIVARDSETGDLGVAVASKFLAVGAVVPHARAGVGALATQALANVGYGADGLALLGGIAASEALGGGAGSPLGAAEVVRRLTEADEGRSHRQLGVVDAHGGSASYTGSECITWAGGRTADNVAAQGNLLHGPEVVDALIDTFLAGGTAFPELLLRALRAGDEAGGDRRGRQSAALLVVRDRAGYGGYTDRLVDLRVDDHPAPVGELERLLDLNHLLLDRPAPEDLLAIDEQLAAELRQLLERAGYTPATIQRAGGLAEVAELLGLQRTGEPREAPVSWDQSWAAALDEWMSVENLEERSAARGWVDPRVVAHLRERTRGVG